MTVVYLAAATPTSDGAQHGRYCALYVRVVDYVDSEISHG